MIEPPMSFLDRIYWATLGGVMVTIYSLGADYADGKLKGPILIYRLTSIPLLIFLSALLSGRLGFEGEMNGIVSICVFLVGRDTIEKIAKNYLTRLIGDNTKDGKS